MRTTLNLDEDILATAKELARFEHRSLGSVISELARRGLTPEPRRTHQVGAFPTFDVEEGFPHITDQMVSQALDDS